MIESDAVDGWPSRLTRMASVAEVHAFGQVTLIFNYLEETVGKIFVHFLPAEISFSEALFHKMSNPDRMLLLLELIKGNERDPEVKTALEHLLWCYDVCNENRNILMHASVESRSSPDFLPMSKRSKNAKVGRIFFHLSLPDLRATADGMGAVFDFGTRLRIWLAHRDSPSPETAKLMNWPDPPQRPPLPDKPPKPRKLTPFQPPKDQPA
jgi:hypothetical protein